MFTLRSTASTHRSPLGLPYSLTLATALVLGLGSVQAGAQTTLQAGDVAVVALRSATPDAVSLVLLRDVEAGTEIRMTDNGWLSAGKLRTGEGVWVWTASVALKAGTTIHLSQLDKAIAQIKPAVGNLKKSGSFDFAGGGDSVLLYQGSDTAPVFIFGLNNTTGAWEADAADTKTSALPPGLVPGSSALALVNKTNQLYQGPLTGTPEQLRKAIGTTSNWVADTSTVPSEPGPFEVTGSVAVESAIYTPFPGSDQGGSDTSAAIALDDKYMVVGDDEGNALRVYPRSGGAAVSEWSFSNLLGITKELDLEAGTRIGDTWYFTGSHGNKSDGAEADNREHLFAVKVTGTGADTQFSFVGKYSDLETALSNWDSSNKHGLGAGYFGLQASSADKVSPEAPNGFSIEGMAATEDGQLLLGFRAPQTSAQQRRNALIIPITNPGHVVGGVAPVLGMPIELNLGGRGIRDIQRTDDGKFLIIAGPAGKADSTVSNNFALFVWAGPGTTEVTQIDNDLDALLKDTGGSFETLVSPSSTAAGTRVQLLQDNGDTVWPGKSKVSKDLPVAEQQFKGNWIVLGKAVAADTMPPQLQSTLPANNATEVGKNTAISFRFNEAIAKGAGSITVLEDGAAFATVLVGDAQISISGATLSLALTKPLQPGKSYEVQLPAGTVQDMADNPSTSAQSLKFSISAATGSTARLLISEVNSNADGGDFFELYNYGSTAIDLSGWSWTDSAGKDTGLFPAGAGVAPGGRLVVLVDSTPDIFQTAWGLADSNQLLAVAGPGLGKGDAVLVSDANGYFVVGMNYGAATLTATDGSQVAPSRNPAGAAVTGVDHVGIVFGGGAAGVSAVWDGKSTSDVRYTAARLGELDAFAQPAKPANIGSPGQVRDDSPPPAETITRISAVQGSGAASPLVGQSATVRGVVTAVLPGLQGFYIQSLTEDDDGKPETSEGIFAYMGSTVIPGADALAPGKTVQFTAKVSEYNGLTQLSTITGFKVTGDAALPAPVALQLPISDMALWERYEGMRVRISAGGGPLVVTDNYTLGRFGTLTLTSGTLQTQYTENNVPSVDGNKAYLAAVRRNQIILDDGSSKSNPETALGRNGQPLSASNTLRAGDTTAAVEGILDQFEDKLAGEHQTSYRVQPLSTVSFTGEARPTVETLQNAVGEASVKVASANVLNYFTTLGKTKFKNPLGVEHEGRGADSKAELDRQTDKIVANLLGLQADVYGLMEVQNNGFADMGALAALTAAMNKKQGSDVFAYVTGPYSAGAGKQVATAGGDAIMVAIIYRKDKVQPIGKAAVPDEAKYDAFNATYGNRVPVAQTFEVSLADGGTEQFTVVVNHLKSKGSVNDADIGDGQGANNQARLRAVQQLQSWLDTVPTEVNTGQQLLLGDFNAYAKEDPISYLEGKGYKKLAPGQFSYSFQGLWGALDHVLVSTSLASKVSNTVKWHINAEEPPALDYNSNFKSPAQQASYYAPDAYRSSDHNPIVLGLNLGKKPVDPGVPQEHVLQLPSGKSLTVVFSSPDQCKLDVPPAVVDVKTLGALPQGVTLPFAALKWSASGCKPGGAVNLSVTYPEGLPANTKYWKWGPTTSNMQPHWYSIPAQVNGNVLAVQLVDGVDGDDDLKANGTIADPGGAGWQAADPVDPGNPDPGGRKPAPVPALDTYALLSLGGLLAMAAAWVRRRKQR
ncbi:MAG: ExeM/NucH family extracellular endonuclease [Comamonas sp.]